MSLSPKESMCEREGMHKRAAHVVKHADRKHEKRRNGITIWQKPTLPIARKQKARGINSVVDKYDQSGWEIALEMLERWSDHKIAWRRHMRC